MNNEHFDETDIYRVEDHPRARIIGVTWLAVVLILAIFASVKIFERMF